MALFLMLLLSCEKDNDLPVLPEDPNDVCSAMDDLNFMKYCYDKFDVNDDKKVSPSEANAVTEIDVESEHISSLKGIEYFKSLTYLDCADNNLKVLDISKNIALTEIDCSDNSLTALDVSKNTSLVKLYCGRNALTSLNVSKNTALTELNCERNALTSLNVSKNSKLNKLDCSHNNLSTEALNSLFKSLPITENGYIDFYNNPGSDTCDRSIYKAKGWRALMEI